MGKWPSQAYYWPTDNLITAQDAIKRREMNDLRTGEIHCHADCYKRVPRTGHSLFARKGRGSPHFHVGPGNSIKDSNCKFERIMRNRSESYRFSQFYHDLIKWFDEEKEEVSGIFQIKSWMQSTTKTSDINIVHNMSEKIDWEFTDLTIVDKNRKRDKVNDSTLLIDISQWPDSHLLEFSKYGKRRVIEEWETLIAKNEEIRTKKEVARSKSRENLQHQKENRRELRKGINRLKEKSNNLFENRSKNLAQFLSSELNNQPNSFNEAEKQIEILAEYLNDARDDEMGWYMAVISNGKHQLKLDVPLNEDSLPDLVYDSDLSERFYGLSDDLQNVLLERNTWDNEWELRIEVVIPSAKLAAERKRKLRRASRKFWKKENPDEVIRLKLVIKEDEERLQETRKRLDECQQRLSKMQKEGAHVRTFLMTEFAINDLSKEINRIEEKIRKNKQKI